MESGGKQGGMSGGSKMHGGMRGGGMPQMMMEMMQNVKEMQQGMKQMGKGMKGKCEMMGQGTETFSVDVVQDNNDIVVYADLAGYDKKNISLSIDDDSLTIVAKREEIPHSGATYAQERPFEVERTIELPSSVKDAKEALIKATYQNGVLEVRLPSSAKKVKIE